MDAALSSIAERGLSSTTLATVAAAAGLSQGAAVFYFKSKDNLILETLRNHYEEYTDFWKKALAGAGDDPVDRLVALVLSDVDEVHCTPKNMALWSAIWSETSARPRFREVCEGYDAERTEEMRAACEAVIDLVPDGHWTAVSLADTLDSITDGMWTRMHISPDYMTHERARGIIVRSLATFIPSRTKDILAKFS